MFFQLRANLLNFVLEKVQEVQRDSYFKKPSKETDWIELMTAIHISNKDQYDRNMRNEISIYHQMTTDVNRAYLLFCTSAVNFYIMHNCA